MVNRFQVSLRGAGVMNSEHRTSLGPLVLALCLLGCSQLVAQGIHGQAQESATAKISGGLPAISGHIYRTDTGAPLPGAVVTLHTLNATSDGKYQHTETATDGSYSFYDVPARKYTVEATCEGFVRQVYSSDGTLTGKFLAINSENPLQNIDFHLAEAGVISGSVVDERDVPVGEIEVSAVQAVSSPGGLEIPRRIQVTRTDKRGSFRLSGLEPGSYYLCVNGPNGNEVPSRVTGWGYRETYYSNATSLSNAQQVRVFAGDETKDIRIAVPEEKRFRINVVVSGPGQDGVPSRYRYQIQVEGRNHSSSTTDDRSFTIPDIPPGEYTLIATAWEDNTYVGKGNVLVQVVDADVQVNVRVGPLGEPSGKGLSVGP